MQVACDLWFSFAGYESNPKVIVWNGSEKLMSVKIHVLKKSYVVKLLKHIEK